MAHQQLFSWEYVDQESCDHDLCMSMTFNCNYNVTTEAKLLLDKAPDADCAFHGYFEGFESNMVALSTIKSEWNETDSKIGYL